MVGNWGWWFSKVKQNKDMGNKKTKPVNKKLEQVHLKALTEMAVDGFEWTTLVGDEIYPSVCPYECKLSYRMSYPTKPTDGVILTLKSGGRTYWDKELLCENDCMGSTVWEVLKDGYNQFTLGKLCQTLLRNE